MFSLAMEVVEEHDHSWDEDRQTPEGKYGAEGPKEETWEYSHEADGGGVLVFTCGNDGLCCAKMLIRTWGPESLSEAVTGMQRLSRKVGRKS